DGGGVDDRLAPVERADDPSGHVSHRLGWGAVGGRAPPVRGRLAALRSSPIHSPHPPHGVPRGSSTDPRDRWGPTTPMQEAQTQDEACAARPHRRWFASWQPFAWAVVVLVGTGWLVQYASAPGPASEVPAAWPAGSAIALHPAKPTLVVLVHPKCPCSRASL